VRQLVPESARLVRTAARELVWGDNAVVWLVQNEHARRTVPDRVSMHVAPLVAELTCTDVSRAMVAEARRNLASCPNVRCAVTDGFTLREFEDDAMDLVFAAGVLTYLAPNPLLAMLDEITRVLRPGGVCISNYGLIDDPDAVRQRLDAVRRAARSRRFNGSVEEAYIESQVTELHDAAGLEVVDVRADEDGGRVVMVGRTSPLVRNRGERD
jgi:SAM-dependent methyltransferase